MAEVTQLFLYWYDKRQWKSDKDHGPRNKVTILPSGPSAIQIKTDVAKALKKISKNVYQYYVVAEVEKSDGTLGYRVVVPMMV